MEKIVLYIPIEVEDSNGGVSQVGITAHIGQTTVHFYRENGKECPIYRYKTPSVKINGKHTKSLRLIMQGLSEEDRDKFPPNFRVPIRQQKARRVVGDRGNFQTSYKSVSVNKMVNV